MAKRTKREKSYTAATVIRAQQRTLGLVIKTLLMFNKRQRLTLRATVDGGTITLDELMNHCQQAMRLTVKSRE